MGKFELNRDTSGREHFFIGKEQVADSKLSECVWQSNETKGVKLTTTTKKRRKGR